MSSPGRFATCGRERFAKRRPEVLHYKGGVERSSSTAGERFSITSGSGAKVRQAQVRRGTVLPAAGERFSTTAGVERASTSAGGRFTSCGRERGRFALHRLLPYKQE